MNENIQHEFFIWEEKNLIEHQKNCENKSVSETKDTTSDTQTKSMPIKWQNITDPKLRDKMRKKEWYENNKDKISSKQKAWREDNKDKRKAYNEAYNETNKDKRKTYRKTNKDKIKVQIKAWREDNKDKIRDQLKTYRKTNKDKIRVHLNNKLKTDIQFKLSHNLRARLHSAIKGNYKVGSAVKDLGCTVEELKQYLESKFQSGMSWDNWSSDGWHIDHIKPLASFDLMDRQQLLEACHYTNLQPLWANENLTKSDKII